MNNLFVFNQTVHGHLHINKNKPCEDASVSYTAPDQHYTIVVVADGHGSDSCFRSQKGSEIATEVTLKALKQFADFYMEKVKSDEPDASDETGESDVSDEPDEPDASDELDASDETGELSEPGKPVEYSETPAFLEALKSERTKKQMIKRLTDSIVSNWYQAVTDDISSNPVTDEEMKNVDSDYADLYRRGLKLQHIYGTTLIAGLLMKNYLVLLQQGDGRCDVFYDNASVDQPIPWDDRCYEVYTTSMCDDDVEKSIRSIIIDLTQNPVAACFMGSDGVEDSFRTMDGTHNYYMQLATQITDDPHGFSDYLKDYLPKLSEHGSGDDISVAGFVDMEQLKELYMVYKQKIEAYNLSESRLQIQFKINSMSRKHGILQSRLQKAKEKLESITQEWKNAATHYNKLKRKVECLQKQVNDERSADGSAVSEDASYLSAKISMIEKQFPSAYSIISNLFQMHQTESSGFEKATAELQSYQNEMDELFRKLYEASKTYDELKAEFEEYDSKFQELTDKVNEMEIKIKELNMP